MTSSEQQRESLNIQLLVDSIPALIHTTRPDGCIDYFNGPGLDYLGATLDDVTGWKWTAFADFMRLHVYTTHDTVNLKSLPGYAGETSLHRSEQEDGPGLHASARN